VELARLVRDFMKLSCEVIMKIFPKALSKDDLKAPFAFRFMSYEFGSFNKVGNLNLCSL